MKDREEKKSRERSRDLSTTKWLIRFGLPYKGFMALALIFMMTTAGLELSVPYILKIAVDSYISPPWRVAEFTEESSAREERIKREHPSSMIPLGSHRYLLSLTNLDRKDSADLEKLGIVSKEPYLAVNLENIDPAKRAKIESMLSRYKGQFHSAGGYYYARYGSLKALSRAEIMTLRSRDLTRVTRLAGIMFLALLGIFIASALFTYLLQYSGQKIMHNIRESIFSHLLTLPQTFFDKNPVGRLTTRVTNDVNAINEMYTSVLVQFVKDVLVITGVIALMFYMNANLTLIILALTVALAIFGVLFRVRFRRAYRRVRMTIGRLNAFVQECVSGITLIKLYMREEENLKRFKVESRGNFNANMEQVFAFATFRPVIEFISVFAVALILWYGGLSVLRLELTLGALLAYLAYIRMLFAPILELAERYNIFHSAIAASENLYELHAVEPEKRVPTPATNGFSGRIEFKNVWFAYNDNEWVLKDISFSISPGETVALVGLTGSGKTTVVNLILKLYEIQRGAILFDGTPIEEFDPQFLRSRVSTVFQDLFLFGRSVSDNGFEHDREFKRIIQAHRIYSAEAENLSSGQRQLVSLGEAFSREAKFLILDEATSHVDAELESDIQRIVSNGSAGRSTLIIAHRLSNVRQADRIIVMHKGEIYEEGTHEELLQRRGIYYNLYRLQSEMHTYSSFSD